MINSEFPKNISLMPNICLKILRHTSENQAQFKTVSDKRQNEDCLTIQKQLAHFSWSELNIKMMEYIHVSSLVVNVCLCFYLVINVCILITAQARNFQFLNNAPSHCRATHVPGRQNCFEDSNEFSRLSQS